MSIYRNEMKFLCNELELAIIEERISKVMKLDDHMEKEAYEVRSVYFDDYENSCMQENQAGISRRSKFRIRIYDGKDSYIRLEIKSKKNGFGKKDSCVLPKEVCENYLRGIPELITEALPYPRRRLSLEMELRKLHPTVIVEYERRAYVYPYGNVRVTFDKHISMCPKTACFLEPAIFLTPIMPKGIHILEVKFDEFLPDVIAALLEIGTLQKTAFSKYYFSRQMEYL